MIKKILVVDDSAAVRHIYQMSLARYKCPVLSASTGVEGLKKLTLNPDVNLLIVDMHMPHMSGLEFINRVKEQEAFSNITVIAAILKEKEADDFRKAFQVAEGILKKPFMSADIHWAIGRLFPELALNPQCCLKH